MPLQGIPGQAGCLPGQDARPGKFQESLPGYALLGKTLVEHFDSASLNRVKEAVDLLPLLLINAAIRQHEAGEKMVLRLGNVSSRDELINHLRQLVGIFKSL